MSQLPNNDIPWNRAHLTQGGLTMNTNAVETAKRQCELCKTIGANGAKWLVKTADGKVVRVHKPCGEQLVQSAPAAVGACLVPSPELKAEWAAKKAERQAREFWAERCPKLLEIKKDLEAQEKTP